MKFTNVFVFFQEFSLNFLFSFFLGVFGVVGIIEFSKYDNGSDKDEGLAMCAFALFGSAAYLVDTVFAIINYNS